MTTERVSGLALALLALIVLEECWRLRLPLGTLATPGPAYVPVLLALALLLAGVLIVVLGRDARTLGAAGWREWRHALAILARAARSWRGRSSGSAIRLTDGAGLGLPARRDRAQGLRAPLVFSLGMAAGSCYLFDTLLRVPLPRGALRDLMAGDAAGTSALGFSVALAPADPPLRLRRLPGRDAGGRAARRRAARRHQPAAARRPSASTPTGAIVMLAGIYYGAMYGGSTTSILMRIPGEAASVMTCIDGYAMARKGRAGAGAGHRRGRLLRRRHGERGRADAAGAAAGRLRPALRPAGVLRPPAAGPARARLHEPAARC